jgi:hypothetical protein
MWASTRIKISAFVTNAAADFSAEVFALNGRIRLKRPVTNAKLIIASAVAGAEDNYHEQIWVYHFGFDLLFRCRSKNSLRSI